MDPKMEGVERRLNDDKHDDITLASTDKERRDSAVADIEEIAQAVIPPKALIQVLDKREGFACAQNYSIEWKKGPWKGQPVTLYCAEPLCITEGHCTGTRFVPHLDQFTSTRERRSLDKTEIVSAVRAAAHEAAKQTGRDEDRTDAEILALVRRVWQKTVESIREKGAQWRR